MGAYRLLLAVVVMLYHSDIHIAGRESGAIAVISFYLLSGYVMTALIERHYFGNARGFYLDRAMRLFLSFCFISY
jgi:peptidoglycan/LPS O-acetylase OafA/YrhL